MLRQKEKDIKSLEYLNGKKIIELAQSQVFYSTDKSFEIWQEDLEFNEAFRVISIPKKKIGFVNTY